MSRETPLCWLLLLSAVLGVEAGTVHAQAPAFTVPYARGFALDSTLKMKLDFGDGKLTTVAIDTGSVGIVVPKSELPASTKQAVAGTIRYTSSGLIVNGFWTEPLEIRLDASGAIAFVPVFAATNSTCHQPATNACRPGSLPHMMGIGFGRPDPYASPDRNPLIHIKNLPPGRPSNYRLTHSGIELGIAHAASIPGMHTIRLQRWVRAGMTNQPVTDYRTPSGTIRLNDGEPQKISILVDTGITDSLIALASGEPAECMPLPRPAGANCTVASGTGFALSMVDGMTRLSFKLDDGKPTTPSSGHWIHLNPSEGAFINTGIRPMAAYDVFYDATAGLFGLNPAAP